MLLKSGEAHLNAESMVMNITELYEEDISPFPSEGCRWLKREFEANLDDLIPDLDMWFLNLAGYSSVVKRIPSWPEEKGQEVKGALAFNFFEEYPQYAWLERHITQANTPDLYEHLQLYEQLRKMLYELLDFMLREKYQEPSKGDYPLA